MNRVMHIHHYVQGGTNVPRFGGIVAVDGEGKRKEERGRKG